MILYHIQDHGFFFFFFFFLFQEHSKLLYACNVHTDLSGTCGQCVEWFHTQVHTEWVTQMSLV